jgi:putative FmdB family regulatory protein
MPTYDYRCDGCEITVPEQRAIADRDNPATCNICRQVMWRMLTAPAIKFKGHGFYSTDKNGDDEAF